MPSAAAAADERPRREKGRQEEPRTSAEEGIGRAEHNSRGASDRRSRHEAAAEPLRQSRLSSQVVNRSLPAAPGRAQARDSGDDRWGARRKAPPADVAEAGHAPGIAGSARFAGRLGAHAQHGVEPFSRCGDLEKACAASHVCPGRM